jgi:hypothetical protein
MKFYEIKSDANSSTLTSCYQRDHVEAESIIDALTQFDSLCLQWMGSTTEVISIEEFESEEDYMQQI